MKEKIAGVVIVVAFLLLAGSCTKWKWGECRKVGHGVMYCVLDAGR